jgi:hypothetical protein
MSKMERAVNVVRRVLGMRPVMQVPPRHARHRKVDRDAALAHRPPFEMPEQPPPPMPVPGMHTVRLRPQPTHPFGEGRLEHPPLGVRPYVDPDFRPRQGRDEPVGGERYPYSPQEMPLRHTEYRQD